MTEPSAPLAAQILQLPWGMNPSAVAASLAQRGWSELQTAWVPQAEGQTCTGTGRFLEWPATGYFSFDRAAPGSGFDEAVLVLHGPGAVPDAGMALDILREAHRRFVAKYDQYSWDEFATLKDAGLLPEPFRCYHWYDPRVTGGTDILLSVVGDGRQVGAVNTIVCYRSPAWADQQCAFADARGVAAAVTAAAVRIIPPTTRVATRRASDGTWCASILSPHVVDSPELLADTAYRTAARRIHLGIQPSGEVADAAPVDLLSDE